VRPVLVEDYELVPLLGRNPRGCTESVLKVYRLPGLNEESTRDCHLYFNSGSCWVMLVLLDTRRDDCNSGGRLLPSLTGVSVPDCTTYLESLRPVLASNITYRLCALVY
jgi:hypothetical protein